MAITEKLELLGKGLYTDIPDIITLKSLPTISELEFVGNDDFDETMIEKILPQSVEEDINFNNLLEIDYQWILRCLRIFNYGPYHTTNSVYCPKCGKTHYMECRIDLRAVECKQLPPKFKNKITLTRDRFLDFDGDITFRLPTIRQILNSRKDKVFQTSKGTPNYALARMCYMITGIKTQTNLTPVDIKLIIEKDMSPADYIVLRDEINNLADYGLRAGGNTVCPVCHSTEGVFVALVDDRFFRPSVGDLRKWRDDKNSGGGEDISRDSSKDV